MLIKKPTETAMNVTLVTNLAPTLILKLSVITKPQTTWIHLNILVMLFHTIVSEKYIPMENQLTALAHRCFKAYIIPGTSDCAYKGHSWNIEKETTTFFNQMPPSMEEMPHCIVQKTNGQNIKKATVPHYDTYTFVPSLNTNPSPNQDVKVSIIMICHQYKTHSTCWFLKTLNCFLYSLTWLISGHRLHCH